MDTTNDLKTPTRSVASVRRLQLLVVAHLALSSVLLGYRFIPGHVAYLPLLNAIGSIPLAQALLLSFWVGMGTSSVVRRIAGGVLAVVYICGWNLLPTMEVAVTVSDRFINFLYSCLQFGLLVGLFAGAFLAVRRWAAHLQYQETLNEGVRPGRAQFSILHMLLTTTVAAVVLGLARLSRGVSDEFDWSYIALMALCFVIFFVNTLCAIWGALAPGPVGWRMMLVFLIAFLLGLALLLPMHSQSPPSPPNQPSLPWWLGPSQMSVVTLVPLGIIVVSLLVVRSCGYRLVSKRQVRPA